MARFGRGFPLGGRFILPAARETEGSEVSYTADMGAAFEGQGMLRQPMTPRTRVVAY